MAETLPFECDHEKQCREMLSVPIDCIEYCAVYREKRAEKIERIASGMFNTLETVMVSIGANTENLDALRRILEDLDVDLSQGEIDSACDI